MDYTQNYNLKKPSSTSDDIADINDISDNMDTIDVELFKVNSNKVDKNQGSENKGKFLVVGDDGNVKFRAFSGVSLCSTKAEVLALPNGTYGEYIGDTIITPFTGGVRLYKGDVFLKEESAVTVLFNSLRSDNIVATTEEITELINNIPSQKSKLFIYAGNGYTLNNVTLKQGDVVRVTKGSTGIDSVSVIYNTAGITDHTQLTNRDAIDQHPMSAITGLETALDTKVDKVEGKGLSTNDYTDVEADRVYEAWTISKQANKAVSFESYISLINILNVTEKEEYSVGQSIYIQTLNVPDLWVYGVDTTSEDYTYTTDEAFIEELNTNGYVKAGYYKLAALETQKVDLTGYAKSEDVPSKTSQLENDSGFLGSELATEIDYIPNIADTLKGIQNGAIAGQIPQVKSVDEKGFPTEWELTYAGGGTSDHSQLSNRDAINQHSIGAITGLQTTLDNKVDKVEGKGLSTNDFNDTLKGEVNSNTLARHSHDNKSLLDELTLEKINNWDNKQDKLTAGENITIVDNVISASGGGGVSVSEEFELIEDIALTEEVNAITRTAEPDGTPYNFKSMAVSIYVPAHEVVDAQYYFYGSGGSLAFSTLWSNTIATSQRYSSLVLKNIGKNLFELYESSGDQRKYPSAGAALRYNLYPDSQGDEIKRFVYGANNTAKMLPVGTNIKIYGVRI